MWNTLPSYIRDTTKSIESFKTLLRKHYKDLTDSVFNTDDPRTLKVPLAAKIFIGDIKSRYDF